MITQVSRYSFILDTKLMNRVYELLSGIPIPRTAQILGRQDNPQVASLEVVYSVNDHALNARRQVSKAFTLISGSEHGGQVGVPSRDIDIVARTISPSRNLTAIWRSTKGRRYVELWKGVSRAVVDVTGYHGDFYSDDVLSSFSFAHSECALIYVAEGKEPETKDALQRFRFKPDFGEGFSGRRRPTTFVLRWDSNIFDLAQSAAVQPRLYEIKTSEMAHDEPIRFGQAIFSPNSDKVLYATGYEFHVDGRFLGVAGCYNRPTGIWQLRLPDMGSDSIGTVSIDAVCTKLTPSHMSCRSPRVTKGLRSANPILLVWLGCRTGGAHIATSTLHSLDITSDLSGPPSLESHKTLVEIVRKPLDGAFPGLYPSYSLPITPFLECDEQVFIALHSHWGSRTTVLLISLMDGSVKEIAEKTAELYSWMVMTTDGKDKIVCSRSSPSIPYEIVVGTLSPSSLVNWKVIDKPELADDVRESLSNVRTSIVSIPGREPLETVLIRDKADLYARKHPCITAIYGGPHISMTTGFSAANTALVLSGYTWSSPNYTASVGYGEDFLQASIGRNGEVDVEDCMASARYLVEIGVSQVGKNRQFLWGGSYGGFIAAHIMGKYPTFFSAAVILSPSISPTVLSSDIPDLRYSEYGLEYPLASLPPYMKTGPSARPHIHIPPTLDENVFSQLHSKSPMRYIDNVSIPVLIGIGGADRRVPNTHGLEFYHALKARYLARRLKTGLASRLEMLVFDNERHMLDGVEAGVATFEATRAWFPVEE